MQLLRAILPRGKGSEFMKTIKDDGAIVITCYYGYGSASESIQSKLKVNKIRKEIVMAILDDENAKIAMDELEEKLVKINTGVAFRSQLEYKGESNLQNESNYQALYVIVDRHEGQKAVVIAQENGAKGATLIYWRGSAKEVKSILLNMNV